MTDKQHTVIVFVRHGQTEWNKIGRWQGQLDSNLTDRGVRDAIRVGLRLARPKSVWHFDHYDERPFSGVYASDLGRVQQTLEGILEHNPHLRDIAVSDERLRERNFGILQGNSLEDLKASKPEHYAKYMAACAAGKHYDPPGAESLQQLCDRMWAAFTDICARHRGQKVLVISHGGALQTLLTKILLGGKYQPSLGEPPYLSFSMTNTALNVVSVRVGKDGHDSPPWLLSLGDMAREHDPMPTQRTAFPIFGSATTTFVAGFVVGVGAAMLASFLLKRKS